MDITEKREICLPVNVKNINICVAFDLIISQSNVSLETNFKHAKNRHYLIRK